MGITAADVNAANVNAIDVADPNARKVVDACRSLHLPMIFVHWGCLFRDSMDLDPDVRKEFLNQHRTNYAAWGHCIGDATSSSGVPCPTAWRGHGIHQHGLATSAASMAMTPENTSILAAQSIVPIQRANLYNAAS